MLNVKIQTVREQGRVYVDAENYSEGRHGSKYTNEHQKDQSTKGSEKEIIKGLGSLIKRIRESNEKTKI